MKLLILFAFFAVVYADFKVNTNDDLVKARDACKTELSLSDEAVEKFKKWQFDDEKSACYINCAFRHMKLYDNDSGFLRDNLLKQLGEGRTDDSFHKDVDACIESSNAFESHCDKAFKGFQCFSKNNLQMIKSSVQ